MTQIKYLVFIILSIIFNVSVVTAQDSVSTNAASEAYRNSNFKLSIEQYENNINKYSQEGKESAELYYNLGNAYFRDNQVAKAILNYERALLLDPGDSDIRHNLRFARTKIEDRIDVAGNLFLINWFNSVRDLFNSNTWGTIAIVLFILFLLCFGMYLFVRILWLKKSAFYTGIVFFVLMICANIFAFNQKNLRVNRNTGIVLSAAISVTTSPDANSKELFQLHEGTKVTIRETEGNWYEIEIANGSVGWTQKETIEII